MTQKPENTLRDVLLITPHIFTDMRGSFYESYNQQHFNNLTGRNIHFVQDNHTFSKKNVLRGLHYQLHTPQAKLIRVITGEIFDVAVDIRKSSPTFGQWVGHTLSAENKQQMWIPEGFAHGYVTISETSEVLYKVTAPYDKNDEHSIIWNDPVLNIGWPISTPPILSNKDETALEFKKADCYT